MGWRKTALIKTQHASLATLEGRVGRIGSILDEMKSERIVALDLRGLSDFADAFVIATMRSRTHMQAVAGKIMETLRAEGLRPLVKPDAESALWTLLDYGDVIVHLFDGEAREYYNLEGLWGDAETLSWEQAELA
jgi:ribosome-associated protein